MITLWGSNICTLNGETRKLKLREGKQADHEWIYLQNLGSSWLIPNTASIMEKLLVTHEKTEMTNEVDI